MGEFAIDTFVLHIEDLSLEDFRDLKAMLKKRFPKAELFELTEGDSEQ